MCADRWLSFAACLHACRKIGLSLGWVYLFMGVMVGSAVPPIAFCITWRKISAAGAISGAVTGLIGAIITWICTAKVRLSARGGRQPVGPYCMHNTANLAGSVQSAQGGCGLPDMSGGLVHSPVTAGPPPGSGQGRVASRHIRGCWCRLGSLRGEGSGGGLGCKASTSASANNT